MQVSKCYKCIGVKETRACFVPLLKYSRQREKMFRPGDLNRCHQLRSHTRIPLSYIYSYRARLILTDKSLTKGTSLLYNNVKLTKMVVVFMRKCQ